MIRVAHTGDTHIAVNHKRWLTLDRALRDMTSQIADAHPDLIVHAGDLGEPHPSAQDLYCQAIFLQRLAGICPVVLVAGNHDSVPHLDVLARVDTDHPLWISTSPDTLALMRGEILHLGDIDPSEIESVDCVIHALPWTAKARVRSWYMQTTGHAAPEEEADRIAQEFLSQMFMGMRAERQAVNYTGPSILLGHLDVSGAKLDSGQPNAAAGMSVSVHDLAQATTSATLLGHIHAQQELGDGEGIWYSGSPCRLSWGEAGADEKGWGLLEFDSQNHVTHEYMDIDSPRLWAVEAEWGEEAETHPTNPDACIGVWQFVKVPDKPSLSDLLSEDIGPDDELRFRYHVPDDQREAVKAIRAREVKGYWRGNPENITYEPIVEPTDHARAPEIASQTDPVDMLGTWAEQDGRADRVTPVVEEKVREIAAESGFSHGGHDGAALIEHTRLRVHGIGRLRDVDLQIPDGITAITGPNGHGKSTLLRSFLWGMHRKAPRGRDTEPLGKWAMLSDSHLILESMNGVAITAAHTLNGERKNVAQSAVLTVDGQILNESGLVKEFDSQTGIYPDYDLYLASAFAEQEGAGAFRSASVAERKAILRTALHLDEIETLSEAAKGRRKADEQSIATSQARIEDLSGADIEALTKALGNAVLEWEAWEAQIEELKPLIAEARTGVAQAEAGHRDVEKAREDYLERKRRIARLRLQEAEAEEKRQHADEAGRLLPDLKLTLITGEQIQKEIDALIPDLREKQTEIQRKRERWEENHRNLMDTQNELAQDNAILERAEDIRAAAGEVKATEVRLSGAEEEIERLEREVERGRDRVEAHGKALARLERCANKLATQEYADRSLQDVPCGGRGEFAGCRFIVDAARARDAIAETRQAMVIDAWDLDLLATRDLDSSIARLRAAKDEAHVCRSRLDAARASAADLPLLEDAEPRAKRLQEKVDALTELEKTLTMTGQALKSEVARLEQERRGLEARLVNHHPGGLEQTRSHVAKVEAEAASLEDRRARLDGIRDELKLEEQGLGTEPSEQEALEALHRARTRLADLEEDEARHRKAIEGVRVRIATLEEQIRVAEDSARKRKDLEGEIARLHQEAADWKFIETGYSKSGVQALLMDAMGPAISERTNSILEEVGSEYRVQLTTTRMDSTGKRVLEDLDLLVTGGGLMPGATIGHLSPGQRVVVGLAFRLGLCLHCGGGGVSPWLLDEADGGLDSENVRRYVPIIRAAMKVGGVSRVMFVTHRSESVEAADNILHVEEGRAKLEVRS